MADREVVSATPSMSSTSTDDDNDAITTSTDSEAFCTWTIVTDKNKKYISEQDSALRSENTEVFDNRVEELQKNSQSGDNNVESRDFKSDRDSTIDEHSDDISIISDSESAGRISPHPFLRQNFNDLNLKFTSGDEVNIVPQAIPPEIQSSSVQTVDDDLEIRRRRKRSKSTDSNLELMETSELETPTRFQPIVRTGLTGLFYVGVLLAVLGFIGKLRYPEWEPLISSKDVVQLEHKLTEIELQNNLMRAEIDLLSKQVNYLTNINENTRPDRKGSSSSYQEKRNSREKRSNFEQSAKCSGETDEDLSRNFIEPNGKEESTAEPSETPNKFSKKNKMSKNRLNEEEKSNDVKKAKINGESKFKEYKSEEKLDKKFENGNGHNFENNFSKNFPDIQRRHVPTSKEQKNYNRREYSKVKRQHNSDDDDYDSTDNFNKQRFGKNYQNSKDQVHKHGKHHKDSKERFEKRNDHHKKLSSAESNSGEWHENLMRHRENARRNNEKQRNDKNWYIERGDAREIIRHVDHHYR